MNLFSGVVVVKVPEAITQRDRSQGCEGTTRVDRVKIQSRYVVGNPERFSLIVVPLSSRKTVAVPVAPAIATPDLRSPQSLSATDIQLLCTCRRDSELS